MKKSLKILVAIIVSLLMSLISFKQLFLYGVEDKFLDLQNAIITPFILGYSLLGLLLFPFIISFCKDLKAKKVLNISKKTLSVIVFILYILTPFVFLQYKNGYTLSIPFILALLEPFKVKYLMEQDIADIIGRNVKLFIISFLLLFISGIICKIVHIEKSQYVYGGLFYLILAHLDSKEYQKNY